jgi:small-conductance mechanosensitive channel
MMTQETHPIVDLTDEALQAILQRALRNTLILGTLASIAVLVGSGWRNGAMLLTGTLISAASILEWRHLVRVINARLDKQRTPTSATAVVLFFVLRLTIFAGVIYGSLKCFQGSVVALLCGLGLAALAVGWEVIRLLRD